MVDDRIEDRYCLVIKQIIPEIECFETVNGCVDTMVYKKTLMSHQQIREICKKCLYEVE